MLGVHPNTVRAWTDAGRLPCLRINARGDRRYRVADLRAFLTGAWVDGPRHARARASGETAAHAERPRASARRRAPRTRATELDALARVSRTTAAGGDLDTVLADVAALLRTTFGYRLVIIDERRDDRLVPRVVDGAKLAAVESLDTGAGLAWRALERGQPVFVADVRRDPGYVPAVPAVVAEISVPIAGPDAPWGVLTVDDDRPGYLGKADVDLLGTVANQLAAAIANALLLERVRRQLHQADGLRRIGAEISGKLDLDRVLTDLVEHAMTLFSADRGAVFRRAEGGFEARVARGLSPQLLAVIRGLPKPALAREALERRRPVFATGYASDPRSEGIRDAIVREGFDSLAIAPLLSGDTALGVLALFHDRPHPWDEEDLAALGALAAQASVAIDTANAYARMATWAAQLQSIQALGTRLSRLTSVRDIGHAIAAELQELIAYHNVRVYRVQGDDLRPVAWKGEIGEYTEEDEEQLALKVGEGITGWVAAHGEPQYLPDAANDPRARTIPGTEDDLPESMLVCPMRFEDRTIGVIVLSKLGLNQFSADDLRLLEIYASFAAQAMSNADATEQLHAQSEALARQLRSQRELLGLTESILSTLEPEAVLAEIADRLGSIVPVDNLGIDVHDRQRHELRPLIARGLHAHLYSGRALPDDRGVAGWVVHHGEGQLVNDVLADRRVAHFDETGPLPGALIVVPMRSRAGVSGVLTVERIGEGATFSEEEFELVKLYAAQASIALANAAVHHAVELRAQRDALTGLNNQGTFVDRLSRAVARREPFSLLMVDLDDFKGYNDSFGHAAGNAVLQRIARALEGAAREADSIFRYGGDEFALLLHGTDAAGALRVAERVRVAIAEAASGAAMRRAIGCSIGVATYPVDGADADALSLAADRALYVAKRSGRGVTATAAQGLALAAEFLPAGPTPVDEPDGSALLPV